MDDLFAPGGLGESENHITELPLPVAGHAGHTDDLTRRDRQRDLAQTDPVTAGVDLSQFQQGTRRFSDGFTARGTLFGPRCPEHQTHQPPLRRFGAHQGPRHRPPAHHGDAIGACQYLGQFVRDEDDGVAVLPEAGEHAEQSVDLMRHEHSGGLVENEQSAITETVVDDPKERFAV